MQLRQLSKGMTILLWVLKLYFLAVFMCSVLMGINRTDWAAYKVLSILAWPAHVFDPITRLAAPVIKLAADMEPFAVSCIVYGMILIEGIRRLEFEKKPAASETHG